MTEQPSPRKLPDQLLQLVCFVICLVGVAGAMLSILDVVQARWFQWGVLGLSTVALLGPVSYFRDVRGWGKAATYTFMFIALMVVFFCVEQTLKTQKMI